MKFKNANYLPPAPFRILIDSREQTPLPFPPSVPTRTVREGDGESLYPGDYSIDGLRNRFAVERKSLPDLIGSLLGHKDLADGTRRYNRDRLIEELTAMRSLEFKAVVVTAPRAHIEAHLYDSACPPANILGMIASIEALTGVQFKFYQSPEECARWLAVEALHFWRHVHGLSELRPKLRPERLAPKRAKMPKPPKPAKGV